MISTSFDPRGLQKAVKTRQASLFDRRFVSTEGVAEGICLVNFQLPEAINRDHVADIVTCSRVLGASFGLWSTC